MAAAEGALRRGAADTATMRVKRNAHWHVSFAAVIILAVFGVGNAKKEAKEKPNIIIFLTDDQDSELGSMQYMPKTTRVFEQGGTKFMNAFASSPICCPSRSTILTGLYTHNHNVYTNNDNCSSMYWRQTFEPKSFGKYLHTAGYRTGYFGKYLNEYNGTYIPPGWHEWVGLVKNSAFYNYTVNFNGRLIKHGDNYHKDYLTDLVANDSVTFLKQSKQFFPNKPVAMVLSMPAPHGPEDSAPQYQNLFLNVTTHRTRNWNYAPNPDKMWLLQVTGKMEPIQVSFTDQLNAKRLQTLQSVDDAVEKMYNELKIMGELDNTYMIYMSDHGYHLGQFGLPKGKSLPYEFDIRIPFYIRGPGIQRGQKLKNIMGTVDVAPTVLDLAAIPVPEDMDGRSIKPLLNIPDENGDLSEVAMLKKRTWRDTYLLQRGKVTKKRQETYELNIDQLPIYFNHEGQIENKCAKPKYQSPCKPGQRMECYQDSRNRMRLRKCKTMKCDCPSNAPALAQTHQQLISRGLRILSNASIFNGSRSTVELKTKATAAAMQTRTRHLDRGKSRSRSTTWSKSGSMESGLRQQLTQLQYGNVNASDRLQQTVASYSSRLRRAVTQEEQAFSLQEGTFMQKCQVVNTVIKCSVVEEYADFKEWKRQKLALEQLIQESKYHLERLKALRKGFQERYETARTKVLQGVTGSDPLQVTFGSSARYDAPDSATPPYPLMEDGCVCHEVDEEEGDTTGPLHETGMPRYSNLKPPTTEDEELDEVIEEDEQLPVVTTMSYATEHSGKKEGRQSRKERKCTGDGCVDGTAKRRTRKQSKDSRRHDPNCRVEGVECHVMDNEHWKVAPRWKLGPFCYCINAVNNTMWCLRTINDTHNFLYCEFINGFIEYYDLNKDPWQFRNAVFDLSHGVLQQLHLLLNKLRSCRGSRECHHRYRSDHASIATVPAGGISFSNGYP